MGKSCPLAARSRLFRGFGSFKHTKDQIDDCTAEHVSLLPDAGQNRLRPLTMVRIDPVPLFPKEQAMVAAGAVPNYPVRGVVEGVVKRLMIRRPKGASPRKGRAKA